MQTSTYIRHSRAIGFRAGFTLVELLIALAIIVGLLAMVSGIFQIPLMKAEKDVLKANLRTMRRALQQFYNDNGRYPYNGQDYYGNLVTFLDDRSSELVQGVHCGLEQYESKRAKYLMAIPPDPTLTDPTPLWYLVPFDNDSDWVLGTDDVGADGIDGSGDRLDGESDMEPSQGEPHVDEDPFGNDDEDNDGKVDEDPPDVRNVKSVNEEFRNL